MTDPIADMLTRIRNAYMAKKHNVLVPFSNIKFEIAKILEKENYIGKIEVIENKFKDIKIELKYIEKKPAIMKIDRVSTPGRKIYVSKDKLPKVLNGLGIAVISTSQGLMTNREAKKNNVGGEILCQVY